MIVNPTAADRNQTRNRLLSLIPDDERAYVLSICEKVPLREQQILHEYMVPIEHIYFIESGLVSVAARVGDDQYVEVWLVGSEGMVGSPAVLGAVSEPKQRRTVRVGGYALRTSTHHFNKAMESLPVFRRTLYAYLNVVLLRAAQSGACNATHELKHRLARWLLVARSCLRSDDIPLTHDILAQLLAVRRASITDALEQFERQGLIAARRRQITIVDPLKLEQVCCDCFRLIEEEFDYQLGSVAGVDSRAARSLSET